MQREKRFLTCFYTIFLYALKVLSISVKGAATTFPVDMVLATCHFIHDLLNEQIYRREEHF